MIKFEKIDYKKNFLLFFLLFSLWFILYIDVLFKDVNQRFAKFVFISMFSINIFLISYYFIHKNSVMLIFLGFLTLYAYPFYMAAFNNVYITYIHRENNFYTLTKTYLIYSLFLIPFILHRDFRKIDFKINFKNNDILFILTCLIFFVLWKYGMSGTTIIESGGYGKGTTSKNSLYEYLLIFMYVMYQFTGKSIIKKIIFFCLSLLYILKDVLFGGRIESLMMILLLFYLIISKKISFKFFILAGVFLLYIMKIFENVRSDFINILSNGDILDVLNPFHVSEKIEYLTSNQGDVYWAGERVLHLIEKKELTVQDRFLSGFLFILSIFFKNAKLGPLANLTTYKMEVFPTVGGGLCPLYIYAMFSILGVFLLGLFIALFIRSNRLNGKYFNVYLLFVLTTFPRWFSYYPIQLIKFCLIAVFIVYVFDVLDVFIRRFCKYAYNDKCFK